MSGIYTDTEGDYYTEHVEVAKCTGCGVETPIVRLTHDCGVSFTYEVQGVPVALTAARLAALESEVKGLGERVDKPMVALDLHGLRSIDQRIAALEAMGGSHERRLDAYERHMQETIVDLRNRIEELERVVDADSGREIPGDDAATLEAQVNAVWNRLAQKAASRAEDQRAVDAGDRAETCDSARHTDSGRVTCDKPQGHGGSHGNDRWWWNRRTMAMPVKEQVAPTIGDVLAKVWEEVDETKGGARVYLAGKQAAQFGVYLRTNPETGTRQLMVSRMDGYYPDEADSRPRGTEGA